MKYYIYHILLSINLILILRVYTRIISQRIYLHISLSLSHSLTASLFPSLSLHLYIYMYIFIYKQLAYNITMCPYMASSAKASFSTAAIFPLIGNIITLTKKVNLSSSPHKKLTCTEGRERCPVQIPRPTLPFQSPHQSMSHIKCASLLRSGQRWIAIF